MVTHNLKVMTQYFDDLEAGRKTAEVRINDRNFQIGDLLLLRETEYHTHRMVFFTGRTLTRTVTHVLKDFVGLMPGYVVLSLMD